MEENTEYESFSRPPSDQRIAQNVAQWVGRHNAGSNNKIEAYGQVHFSENDRKSWYIGYPFEPCPANHNNDEQTYKTERSNTKRHDMTSSPGKELVKLMREEWEIPPPELIISVTGGAKLFKLAHPQISATFERELVSAAATTDAWVFTGGTYSGVMKEVGAAFEKWTYKNSKTQSRVPVIGITSWYYTTDYDQLIQREAVSKDNKKHYRLNFLVDGSPTENIIPRSDFQKLYRNRNPHGEESKSYPIDPNHTHFILLDDGCGPENTDWRKYGYDVRTDLTVPLRAEIEKEACRYDPHRQIPIIQLLIEGGASSVLTICEAVKEKTPVIVIQGTGRAADLIADICKAVTSSNGESREPVVDENFDRLIKSAEKSGILNKTNKDQFIKMITSQEASRFLTIFPLRISDSEFKLSDAILKALLQVAALSTKHKSKIRMEKLKLAMAWNKFDQVENDLLKETDKGDPWSEGQLDGALYSALTRNSVQFVQLLVEQGASFDRLRRLIDIKGLYKKRKSDEMLPRNRHVDRSEGMRNIYYKSYLNDEALKIPRSYQAIDARDHLGNICETANSLMEQPHEHEKSVVFNVNDAALCNSYVTQVTIEFSQTPQTRHNVGKSNDIILYVVSRTIQNDCFQIVQRYDNLPPSTTLSSSKQLFDLKDSPIYLEQNQILAVGFGSDSVTPRYFYNGTHYALGSEEVDKAYESNTSVEFRKGSSYIAVSFHLIHTSEFIRDIFLCSVFLARYDLAVGLCSYSPNTTVAALLASKIFRTAARAAHVAIQKVEYISKENEFDMHAAQIIDRCFAQNEELALQLLTTKSELYFGYSPLELAKEARSRSFLSTKCVQKYMDKLWYGDIDEKVHRKSSMDFLIFILCFFFILVPFPFIHKLLQSSTKKKWMVNTKRTFNVPEWSKIDRLFNFFHGRAIVRFYYNIIFYVLFLGLFSFVMLTNYFPYNDSVDDRYQYPLGISKAEIILHLCLWSLVIEEVGEFTNHYRTMQETSSWKRRTFSSYFFDDKWNMLDIVTILIYLLGFISRFFVIEQAFIVSKIAMCIDLFLWYVRTLHLFAAYERLGANLLMIFHTMKDLTFFICFILVFLAGYSISSYALITTTSQVNWIPNDDGSPSRTYYLSDNATNFWTWNLIRNVMDWGMWKVYGQVDLIDHDQIGPVSKVTVDSDAYGNTTFVLTILFVCVANVLLLNVLVALFNVTLDKVKGNAHGQWAYHRFLLVEEYSKKSPLPPPFNILYYIWEQRWFPSKIASKIKNASVLGSLDDSSQLAANTYGFLVFNGADRIDRTGWITKISINFCIAPTSPDAKISLYIAKKISDNVDRFSIENPCPIPIGKLQMAVGTQTFSVQQIPVEKGDYLAFHFADNAGNPFTLERDSYYTRFDPSTFGHDNKNGMSTKDAFMHCPSQGISVSFTIKDTVGICERITKTFRRPNKIHTNDERSWTLPMQDSQKLHSSYYNLTKFQKRDNMLRESSIAQDHWEIELEAIKKKEREALGRGKASESERNKDKYKYEKQQSTIQEKLQKYANQ